MIYYLYSTNGSEDNNGTPDADRKRYPSKPQSDTTDSMVDMIMGASASVVQILERRNK